MNQRNFFIIVITLLLGSIIIAADRYLVRKDFIYFLTEEEVPNQFDIATYKESGL